ncbi:hypothetical protein N8895_03390 [Candidatus Pelagibacter sp.]|nr:hypothetical protein [Candidatus Pelagibacter sp.]
MVDGPQFKNNMNCIGINLSHNSSASLMVNGEIKLICQEERFLQVKSPWVFPKLSLEYINSYLKKNKLKVHKIAFSTEFNRPFEFINPMSHYFTIKDYKDFYGEKYYLRKFKGLSVDKYIRAMFTDKRNKLKSNMNMERFKLKKNWFNTKLFQDEQILAVKKIFDLDRKKIYFLDHHTCHAHYAYFGSVKGYKKNFCVLTLDSEGDVSNQTVWVTKNSKNILKEVARTETSDLARIYSFTTLLLSMKPHEHEFKVMGLAAYAKYEYANKVYQDVFKNILKVKNCKIIHNKRPKNLYSYLEESFKKYRFDNIAGGLQIFLEKIVTELVIQVHKKYKIRNFALSGGISMNIKMNKVISELPFVDKIFVPPSGSDESLCAGACYYLEQSNSKPLENIYLGINIDKNDEKKYLPFKDKSLIITKNVNSNQIAKLLSDGHVIGVARGREEFGARALGNRSIIANPSKPDVVQEINEAIKNRDFWMPFALSVMKDKQHQILKNPKKLDSSFMTIGFDTISKNLKKIKSGTHPYDGTVRPQILDKKKNEKYYEIIESFYKITGIPAVLNTSLNLHGYPISSTLENVIHTFKNSGLKYLYVNDKFLIKKKNV